MFNQQSPQGHKSHLRFYIFMVTLVLGGLFFLLYANDHEGTGFVSAIVGLSGNVTDKLSSQGANAEPDPNQELSQLLGEASQVKGYRSVPVSLSFSRVPTLEQNATIDGVNLDFDDLSTTIIINGDKLELKNLKQVDLSIQDFVGQVTLETSEFSLSGTAKSIEVNNIAFSSEKSLPISFQGLNYKQLQLFNIELKNLELPRGSGELKVGEKLRYLLEDEELKMLYFKGALSVDKRNSTNSMLALDGDVKGLYDNGDLLTFTLH